MIMGLGRSGAGGLADVDLSSFDGSTISANVYSASGIVTVHVNGLDTVSISAGGGATALHFSGTISGGGDLNLKNFNCPINFGLAFDDGNNDLTLTDVVILGGIFIPPSGCNTLVLSGTTGIEELDLTSTIPTYIDASAISTLTTIDFPSLGSSQTLNYNFANNEVSTDFFDALYAQQAFILNGLFNLGTTLYDATQVLAGSRMDIGSGYDIANDVATSGGSGTGLTLNITQIMSEVGSVVEAEVANPGTGYANTDTVTISGGDGLATFSITQVGNTRISAFSTATGSTVTYNHT